MLALWLAVRDPEVPLAAKALAAAVAGYALSPIDLIPDFVPILGYLDDLILVPFGIWLTVRLIPVAVMARLRQAADGIADRPRSYVAPVLIVAVWIALGLWLSLLLLQYD